MAGRLARLRRPAFVAALITSAALYVSSLVGIAGAGGDLLRAPTAGSAGQLAPVTYDGCPSERDDAVRL